MPSATRLSFTILAILSLTLCVGFCTLALLTWADHRWIACFSHSSCQLDSRQFYRSEGLELHSFRGRQLLLSVAETAEPTRALDRPRLIWSPKSMQWEAGGDWKPRSVFSGSGIDCKVREREIVRINDAFAVPSTLLLPAGWIIYRWRLGRRESGCSRCVRCGYDMRASPVRCPECGAARTEKGENGQRDKTGQVERHSLKPHLSHRSGLRRICGRGSVSFR